MLRQSAFALSFLALVSVASPSFAEKGAKAGGMTYSVSPGLTMAGGAFGPSINSYVGFAPLLNHEFYVGGDFSLDLFFPNAFVMNLGILPSAWYQFALPRNPEMRLVLGISLGPAIVIGSYLGYTGGGVAFEFLFRPGFLYQISPHYAMGGDFKFGVLSNTFVFKPTFNFVWTI